jgi:hypothetical protein
MEQTTMEQTTMEQTTMEQTTMERLIMEKNVVLIGGHSSGKRIFMSRLVNIFSNVEKYKLKVMKSVSYHVMTEESSNGSPIDDTTIDTSYDINISVISLEDMDTYNFTNVHSVLFFSNGTDEIQISQIAYFKNKYIKNDIPCAFLCPYDITITNNAIIDNFRIIKWHCSIGPYVSINKYRDIVINLIESKYESNKEIIFDCGHHQQI